MSRLTKQLLLALRLMPVATIAAPVVGRAQDQAQTVALAIGPTFARSPLADTVGSGRHVLAGIGFNFGERMALRMDGMYQQLESLAANARDPQMVGFMGSIEIAVLSASSPYLLGGYGVYQTLKSGNVPASEWETGYNFGAGYRLRFTRVSIFGEVRLHRVRGEGKPAMVPLSVGIRI
jgi:hypothetical protein